MSICMTVQIQQCLATNFAKQFFLKVYGAWIHEEWTRLMKIWIRIVKNVWWSFEEFERFWWKSLLQSWRMWLWLAILLQLRLYTNFLIHLLIRINKIGWISVNVILSESPKMTFSNWQCNSTMTVPTSHICYLECVGSGFMCIGLVFLNFTISHQKC